MKKPIALALDRSKMIAVTQLTALIGVAVAAPLLGHQFITGPVVNATLFIATVLLGTQAGIMVGLVPSVIALSIGLLPGPLAPMVPYIMIGNAILVLAFGLLKSRSYWLAVGVASLLKFLFLFATSSVVIGLLVQEELASSVASMLSYPQLLTAVAGGVLASVYLGVKKRVG